ncbi:MAG: DUF1731 domain-containing protein, partial [Isosphaeraceae bacterium]
PGAPIGSGGSFLAKGQQWMSWVHIDDIAGIFQMAVEKAEATGPINGTAPNPVRNAEFSKTLSSVLRKPYTPWRFFLPVGPPDFVIQLMLGEVAGVVTAGQKVLPTRARMLGEVAGVVTAGQKVLPTRARILGYHYRFPDLVAALRDVYTPKPVPSPPSQKPVAAGTGSHH